MQELVGLVVSELSLGLQGKDKSDHSLWCPAACLPKVVYIHWYMLVAGTSSSFVPARQPGHSKNSEA